MTYANYDFVVDQLRREGLILELPLVVATGKKSVRCLVEDGDAEKRGWYRIHEWITDDGEVLLVGSYGIFSGNDAGTKKIELTKRCGGCGLEIPLREKKCSGCGAADWKPREISEEQKAAIREKQAQDKKRAADERQAEIDQAAQWAAAVWRSGKDTETHDYLAKKKLVGSGGARIFESNDGLRLINAEAEDYKYLAEFHGALMIPMLDPGGKIFGLQFILDRQRHAQRIERTGRDKHYWPQGMTKEGKYWLIGGTPGRIVLVAEGFATAMSLHNATNLPIAVAFDAGNLPKVAKALKSTYRRTAQLICADDDHVQKCAECKKYTKVDKPNCAHCGAPHKKQNAGKQRAQEAALLVDGTWITPEFADPRPEDRKGPTDFNDLHVLEGLQAVRGQIEVKLTAIGIDASPPPARSEGAFDEGGGERPQAQSVMPVDDIVERFIPLDDGTGDYVFDTWTAKIAKRSQMLTLLPAGARADDIKRHPLWLDRGAYYLDQVGFDPSGKDSAVKLNTWQGWPMLPAAGKCEQLLELIHYLCSADPAGEKIYEWLLDWMAYPLQNPGAKMASAVIMHGPQGTGKSTIFQSLAKIYGDYSTVLNQRGLEDRFNSDWSDSKLFILAEEVVTRAEMWHIKNELKELVTGEWIRINPKNIAAYRQRNQVNIAYLSNENQPLPIDNDDRRHLVIHTPQALSAAYYDAVNLEIDRGGIAAFYDFLLRRDLSNFHPKKRPPDTEAKQRLIELSAPSEAIFVAEWIAGHIEIGNGTLPFCPCSGADLHAAYAKWSRVALVNRPRDRTQFINYLANLRGWEAGKSCHTYQDLLSSTAKNRKMVVPSEDAIATAKKSGTPTLESSGKKARWLTEGFFMFRTALDAAT